MSGVGGSTAGGEEVKVVVERVLNRRIVNGEVQYLIQWQKTCWEPESNLDCSQHIAEFEMELKQRENKKSEKVSSQFADMVGVAGHASNTVSGCNQNQEGNLDGDIEKECGGSKKVGTTKNSKELEAECTSPPTVTDALPLKRWRKNEESNEDMVTSQVGKDRGGGYVPCNVSGGSVSNEDICEGKPYAEDTERVSVGSKIISTGKQLASGDGSICSPTVSKELEALLNPVILTNLFRMVPPKLLATYRLVCKTWEENARMSWRSSSTLTFLYSKRKVTMTSSPNILPVPYSPTCYNHAHNATTLPEFLKFLDEECDAKPYRQFHLKNWKLFEATVEKAKSPTAVKGQIDRFWISIGTNVTVLTLTDCEFSGPVELRKILFQSCPNMKTLSLRNCTTLHRRGEDTSLKPSNTTEYSEPACSEQRNLKSLSVYTVPDMKRRRQFNFPITHLELLSHFPSLTWLQISYPTFDLTITTPDTREWMNAIKVIRRHDEQKLSLKHFEIDASDGFTWYKDEPVIHDYFNLLKKLKLPLLSLCIDLGASTTDENLIKDLLLCHGTTLQKMVAVERSQTWETPKFGFPGFPYGVELDNLQSLDMCDRFCQNMNFIKHTPNLEELRIYEQGYSGYRADGVRNETPVASNGSGYQWRRQTHIVSKTFKPELENFQLVKLKKLELGCKMTDDDLTSLAKWLPNIEELTMCLNDAQFGVICKQWSKLVHLHVVDVGLTDTGIIGAGLGAAFGFTTGINGNRAPITVLNGLKCFKIREGPFIGIRLTDISAIHGFLELPQLQILRFRTCVNETGFGNATMRALCAKIPDCRLHGLNSHWNRTVGCPCCEHSKLSPKETECVW